MLATVARMEQVPLEADRRQSVNLMMTFDDFVVEVAVSILNGSFLFLESKAADTEILSLGPEPVQFPCLNLFCCMAGNPRTAPLCSLLNIFKRQQGCLIRIVSLSSL